MVLDSFRRKLRQEARIWREEGIIDTSVYQQLEERYQFYNLETAASDRFVVILIALGSILLGLGIITFVAANWQAWSREVKITLLLSLFLVTNVVGFYLWRQPIPATIRGKTPRRRKQTFGHGLLLLGALILGANMALVAQMFHIRGSSYELFLAWGIGVLIMAYSLRLTTLGILSFILLQIGYWWGLGDLWTFRGELTWTQIMLQHMPLMSWVIFVPLAYLCRSRWIFGLGAVAFATSLQFNFRTIQILTYSRTSGWLVSLAFAIPPALLWSYDDLRFPKVTFRHFQPLARTLTLVFFSILFYFLSFRWIWRIQFYSSPTDLSALLKFRPVIDVIILGALALWQWWYLLRQRNNRHRQRVDINTIAVGSFILISALVPLWHVTTSTNPNAIAILIFNVLLAILACGLIRQGLDVGKRCAFWGGMVLLTLQIISRMLEYDTGLLFKSFVFVLCGVAVILAGLWFERRLHALSDSAIQPDLR
ncbi:MAG: DUF2157 domain-containing protein [Calothrix sp. MO_192.B10]|nr:DUF2157 domain-containing protein [Calothrix sp. MO_192.B10]